MLWLIGFGYVVAYWLWICCGLLIWICCGLLIWICCDLLIWICCGLLIWICCGLLNLEMLWLFDLYMLWLIGSGEVLAYWFWIPVWCGSWVRDVVLEKWWLTGQLLLGYCASLGLEMWRLWGFRHIVVYCLWRWSSSMVLENRTMHANSQFCKRFYKPNCIESTDTT